MTAILDTAKSMLGASFLAGALLLAPGGVVLVHAEEAPAPASASAPESTGSDGSAAQCLPGSPKPGRLDALEGPALEEVAQRIAEGRASGELVQLDGSGYNYRSGSVLRGAHPRIEERLAGPGR